MNTLDASKLYKLPAGILALLVHAAFFSLLYFGLSWQTHTASPAVMSVALWKNLPNTEPKAHVVPPVEPVKPVPPPPAPPPPTPVKPDIVIPDKKVLPKLVAPVEPPKLKPPVIKPQPKPKPKPKTAPSIPEAPVPVVSAAERQAMQERAAQAAAIGREVDKYSAKIRGKIRRNIVMPPDVPKDAQAEYVVTLLPGGSVLHAKLAQSSGNAAYDNAVERAILKSQPLPLPADASMFKRFRELNLSFKPVE